ncbi:survival protein sure-like phosphatase/nucleotidase [Xylariomycetidae sp. FL2044]|nr:survival protein sure-like phosphatase/nucleotidase [Xylariomycetidae sp. FL2044]
MGIRILLSNDDGWDRKHFRHLYDHLKKAGHDVILSAPLVNQSGLGRRDVDADVVFPTPVKVAPEDDRLRTKPGETPWYYGLSEVIPQPGKDGFLATGYLEADERVNYVDAFPVTAARYGLSELSAKFWDGKDCDLVISGPNDHWNLGTNLRSSGTANVALFAAVF